MAKFVTSKKVEIAKEESRKELAIKENELTEVRSKIEQIFKTKSYTDRMHDTDLRDLFNAERNLEREIDELKLFVLPTEKKFFNEHLFSDVHAYACVEEITPRMVKVVRLNAEVTEESKKKLRESFIPGGFCGHTDNSLQEWKYEMPEDFEKAFVIRLHKDGGWYPAGQHSCPYFLSDAPHEHYDYNF